ncbi:beta strand repeat-containing protein [Nocardioides mesophilus]|uniref:IPT/TIG domain-containing protein n=1 Tax=Nocardioides mesophilus TaxID=433659 RepID=A0A7G9R7K4_9ACTN|nr:IPT/TIG domain-containing protein [Nocardioides mesophilus]QNN51579.1 IPT/TIG domain-containing protein [Nocardioides mesophilus]
MDVSTLNMIGLSGTMDWGVHAYDATGTNGIDPRNGGIVGSLSYDTTRNELDPRYAAAEDWQPGISDLPVELHAPVDCGTHADAPCDADGYYELASDGSYAKGKLLNTYVSEHWSRPTGCTARDVDGKPLVHRADDPANFDEDVLAPNQETDGECISAILQSVQYGPYATDQGTPDANFGAAVDGNYGFGDGCFKGTLDATDPANPTCNDANGNAVPFDALGSGDYLVSVDIPDDLTGHPMYNVTGEEDINIAHGDQIVPQVPPPACAGALHTVDVAGGAPTAASLKTGTVADNNALTWTAASAGPTGNDVTVALVAAGADTPLSVTVTGNDVVVGLATDSSGAVTSTAGDVRSAVLADASASGLLSVADTGASDGTGIVTEVAAAQLAGGAVEDGYPQVIGDGGVSNDLPVGVTVPASTPVDNPTFVDIGGSPYEGQVKPLCDTKLVSLNNGKSIVPMFNLFTDVPIPSRLFGLIVDDINYGTDPRSTLYGEKPGIPFAPVGIYDFNNRLVQTVESDFNGYYETLLPSTDHISCPTPSGVCTGMYRFVGNDPGVPGALNANYNPRYRTIATEFEAMPGVTIPTDLAPTQVGAILTSPTTGLGMAVSCPVDPVVPQLFAVSKPYVDGSGSFTIEGTGFGSAKGTGEVTLDGTALPTTAWSSTTLQVTVPAGTVPGAHTLKVTADNGEETVNGLTFHVLGAGYSPTVREVGPGRTGANQYATIQAALDAAYANNGSAGNLVVVYPNNATAANPRGAYYENLVMASPVKLQGVGSGGFQGNTYVAGTVLDAGAFGGDTDLATAWYAKVGGLTWDGNQTVSDGEAIYLLASSGNGDQPGRARSFGGAFHAAIDGFDIRGGDQQGFPGNINELTGQPSGLPPNIVTQGGAVFANAYVKNLQITNNVVENNGGGYGTIRIGTPDLAGVDANQHNEGVRIADNRIISNAGTNLAGAVGLFGGSDGYEVSGNDICGNFSLEYGAGVSVYGLSPGGKIHHNRIYFNNSNDEGAGIMIAGALPADPTVLSPGTGAVDITHNLIQGNLSNDDGGGIRFLMSGASTMNVVDNTIVNNVSTHEGAGVAINDAPNVRLVNNTIMKNTTTATAVTSNGAPAPAGVSTSLNSDQLQGTLPAGAKPYSDPVMFNNILWDNRAGTRAGTTVTGIGLAGDSSAVDHWDVGLADGTALLSPLSSVIQQDAAQHAYATDASNSTTNPGVVSTYDTSVAFATWRQNPAFVDATLVAAEVPANQLGDYHLAGTGTTCTSPACNLGVASTGAGATLVNAPATDIDDEVRPALGGIDAGSDEFGSTKGGTPPPPPPAKDFFFSTAGLSFAPIPALPGDVLRYNGSFSRHKAQVADLGLPLFGVNIDGLSMVNDNHFYVSFDANITIARPGPDLAVADEDVAEFDNGTWSMFFDASARGLSTGIDLDAISVVNGSLYFSVNSTTALRTNLSGDVNDVYAWTGANTVARVVTVAGTANLDSLVYTDATHLLASFSVDTTLTGAGSVQDEDIVELAADTWSVWFDGTAAGLTSNNQDIDAFSLPGAAVTPPPVDPPPGPTGDGKGRVVFSTLGDVNPDGVTGTADDADLYSFDGTTTTRELDVTALPVASRLPAGANLDGYDRIDATHFYASFAGNTSVPGLGTVQDEDVILYDNGTWSVWFDATSRGLTAAAQDIDAISVSGNTLYFSTAGNTNPRRVTGTADDADIYSVDVTAPADTAVFTRVWDATANGVPSAANVDGYVRVDATHFYLSFRPDTTLPGLGAVQDEDVVLNNGGTWSSYFDGTAHGLTAAGADVDAFDIP